MKTYWFAYCTCGLHDAPLLMEAGELRSDVSVGLRVGVRGAAADISPVRYHVTSLAEGRWCEVGGSAVEVTPLASPPVVG